MIHISNLNKRYFTVDGEITALDNVSLDIAGASLSQSSASPVPVRQRY